MANNIKPSLIGEITDLVNRYRRIIPANNNYQNTYNLIWNQDQNIDQNSLRAQIKKKMDQWFYDDAKPVDISEKPKSKKRSADREKKCSLAEREVSKHSKEESSNTLFQKFNSLYRNYFFNENSISSRQQGNNEFSRGDRWSYAIELFQNYNMTETIFGGGFGYLGKYNSKFSGDKNGYDYPHSPILSALLYSGIIGVFFYLFFLVKSLQYYLNYRFDLFEFVVFFAIIMLFVLISGNSHFSFPVLIFITIIPFFYKGLISRPGVS